MKLPGRKFLQLTVGAAALPAVSGVTWAQAYPSRPVSPQAAAIRRPSMVLTGGAQVAPRPAAIRPCSMAQMAGGLAPQRSQANAKAIYNGTGFLFQDDLGRRPRLF
jgi:hypothetical protein